MPIRGPFNLNWPWRWLLGEQLPGTFAVPKTVQPVVNVSENQPVYHVHNEQRVTVAGNNDVVLPAPANQGLTRIYEVCTLSTNDAADISGPVGMVWFLRGLGAANATLGVWEASEFATNRQMPLIGGRTADQANATPQYQLSGVPHPILLQSPDDLLRIRVPCTAGGDTLTLISFYQEVESSQPFRTYMI